MDTALKTVIIMGIVFMVPLLCVLLLNTKPHTQQTYVSCRASNPTDVTLLSCESYQISEVYIP